MFYLIIKDLSVLIPDCIKEYTRTNINKTSNQVIIDIQLADIEQSNRNDATQNQTFSNKLTCVYDDMLRIGNETYTNDEIIPVSDKLIYPNPSTGQFFLINKKNEATYSIKISSQQGVVIYSKMLYIKSNEKYLIDISSYPKGIYFLSLSSVNDNITEKIVLQ